LANIITVRNKLKTPKYKIEREKIEREEIKGKGGGGEIERK
jgi:hypothetical protein